MVGIPLADFPFIHVTLHEPECECYSPAKRVVIYPAKYDKKDVIHIRDLHQSFFNRLLHGTKWRPIDNATRNKLTSVVLSIYEKETWVALEFIEYSCDTNEK
ncbi:hypothetical protein LCGC14_0194340 [marine sediment metagenome]|uniref:Uncharacterized protein n=1 Tax=marine sediment metagenome TaxID=412755 RepID=A0A0F9V1K7_9ZZZZ|nr:hypothetical protein [bacterium]